MKSIEPLRERLISIAPELGGLKPHAWMSVDLGFSREDFKEILFAQGIALGGEAVTQAPELAFRIVQKRWPKLSRVSATGRQEILQKILKLRELRNQFPELSRLRRQRGFWRKIDKALQQGRRAFTHAGELDVLQERLKERGFQNPVRDELRSLTKLYEAFLNSVDLVDEIRGFQLAIEALSDLDSAQTFRKFFPKQIYRLSVGRVESLELSFWERVREWVPVEAIEVRAESLEVLGPFQGERWHTLDDAAEAWAETVFQLKEKRPRTAIVIPDIPSVRRSVERVLRERGIPKADPRDPQWVKLSEALKKALLPLKLISSQWRCADVIEYAHIYLKNKMAVGFSEELHARGIIRGLKNYQFQKPPEGSRQVDLSNLEPDLQIVAQKFQGRFTLDELSHRHLEFLKGSDLFENSEVLEFLESAYIELIEESKHLNRSGLGVRKAPVAVWVERLERYFESASPPQPRMRPIWGVEIHRLGQIPLQKYDHVSFFGVPASFLDGTDAALGDPFLTDREREVLGTEFSVRSRQDLRLERLRSVRAWAQATQALFVYDAELDWDGRERESLKLFARQAAFQIDWSKGLKGEYGGHTRWLESHRPLRRFQKDRVRLKTEIPVLMKATTLDLYSRCPFRALSQARWNLRDLRESEIDLWGDSRGTLLHRAVRLLVERWGEVSPESALEQAWKDIRPRGLISGARLKSHVKERLLKVIRAFSEKEAEYRTRVQPQVFSLEGPELRDVIAGVEIRGIPDRIDLVNPADADSDGFFILDYKTSSANPKGREVLSEGYHLQLSFYAVSARKLLRRPVHGLQFVELNKNAGRTKGVFFEQFNGKGEGKLTNTTRANQSLVPEEPTAVWEQIENHIRVRVEQFKEGIYDPRPFSKKPGTECDSCQIDAVCGRARRRAAGIDASGDEEA